jgi:hypothetical protein
LRVGLPLQVLVRSFWPFFIVFGWGSGLFTSIPHAVKKHLVARWKRPIYSAGYPGFTKITIKYNRLPTIVCVLPSSVSSHRLCPPIVCVPPSSVSTQTIRSTIRSNKPFTETKKAGSSFNRSGLLLTIYLQNLYCPFWLSLSRATIL